MHWRNLSKETLLINSNRVKDLGTALDSAQISLLKKHDNGLLTTRIAILLNDLRKYAHCQFDEHTAGDLARNLIETFWHLHFDELILVFRNGINGHYGKLFGSLQYVTITDWLLQHEINRDKFFENKNVSYNSVMNSTKDVTISKEEMYLNAIYKAPEKKEERIISHDERQFGFFQAFKNDYTIEQLNILLENAKNQQWTLTFDAIQNEIKLRQP